MLLYLCIELKKPNKMKDLILIELQKANIAPEGNMISKIEEAVFFVQENGAEWFNENSCFGVKLKEIVLNLLK